MKKCENCEEEHVGEYGSGRFCSNKCARGFSTKANRSLINEKVKLKLTIDTYKKICKECQNGFETKIKRLIFCSNQCSAIFKSKDDDIKLKLSLNAKERVANGTHIGWQSRKIRSYAEKFFEKVLINNNIKFDIEYKINKRDLGLTESSNYFLDFYLTDYNIDLEIDGKQHEYPERKIRDEIRDELLNKNGYTVYRIKWKNPNNDENKKYIESEINKLLLTIKKIKNKE